METGQKGANRKERLRAVVEEALETYAVLPEVVTNPGEVIFLNLYSKLLFDSFREAAALDRAGNERESSLLALRAVVKFIERFEPAAHEGLHIPLFKLSCELQPFDNGKGDLTSEPTPRTGRPHEGLRRHSFIGLTVAIVRALRLTGMKQTEAYQAVAELLRKHEVPNHGSPKPISARTVRKWDEDVAQDTKERTLTLQLHF